MVVELECLAVPARGLIGGELPECALGGPPSVVHGLGSVGAHDRGGPVAGELAQPLTGLIPALLLKSLSYLPVYPRAARGAEPLV